MEFILSKVARINWARTLAKTNIIPGQYQEFYFTLRVHVNVWVYLQQKNLQSSIFNSSLHIINFSILWNVWFSKIFCKIHWSNVLSTFDMSFSKQNITFFASSLFLNFQRPTFFSFFMRVVVIFAAFITSALWLAYLIDW